MTNDQPTATIKPQNQTTLPPTSDATIMNDPVVTMDSATALMGGQAVIVTASRQTIVDIKPQAIIRNRR